MGNYTRRGTAIALVTLTALALSAPPATSDPAHGWTKLHGRVRPPGASAAAMAYDEARGELVLFPGYDGQGGHGGTWLGRGRSWHRAFPGTEPESRYGGAMVYDEARERVLLFGGYGSNPEGGPALALDDTWSWDGQRWHREDPSASPSPRAFAAMAYDGDRGQVVLFGGIGIDDEGTAYSTLGDTWTWNGHTWSRRQPAAGPSKRHSAGIAFDGARGEVVLFGGTGQGTPNQCTARPLGICIDLDGEGGQSGERNDTWTWDGEAWTQRSPVRAPDPRSSMGMAYDPLRERVVLFSGVSVGGLYWDTWTWDGANWIEVTPDEQPGPRFTPSMAFDPSAGQVVLYGGHRITYFAADSWGWDGAEWRSLEEPTPPERLDGAMAADPAGGGVVLFGGIGDTYLGDTWRYDGGWRRLSPAASPPARFKAAVTTDTARDEIVVFGGHAPGEDLGDTWAWTGGGWEERTPDLPDLSPLPRYQAAMAFDEARGEAVLFGGWNSDLGLDLADTWTWNGETWTPEMSVVGPPALRHHMMAYDAARREVVLYGGIDEENEVRGDTWTWDGSTWTLEEPTVSPGPRAGGVMTYDAVTERVLLVGGLRGESPPHVWAWNGTTWTDLDVPPGPARTTWSSMAHAPDLGGNIVFGAGDDAPDETWRLTL